MTQHVIELNTLDDSAMWCRVPIRPHHGGGGMYRRGESGDEYYENFWDYLSEVQDYEYWVLGEDELPPGVKDIRGLIYVEPDVVVYYRHDDDPDDDGYMGFYRVLETGFAAFDADDHTLLGRGRTLGHAELDALEYLEDMGRDADDVRMVFFPATEAVAHADRNRVVVVRDDEGYSLAVAVHELPK